jgi:hypothetical protein
MKYINLEGLTPLQIIQKYEELLLQRENIIKQLSNQLNDSQQKYIEVSETIDLLTTKNKELNEKKLKLDKTLNQQRTDKDLLFIKLNNLISENDKLKNLITGKKETKAPSPPQKGKDKNKDTQKRENKNTINNNESKNIRLELKKEEITITKDNKAQKDLNETKKEDNKDNNKEKDKEKEKEKEKDKKEEEIKDEKNLENMNINNVIKEEKEKEKSEDKKEDDKKDKKEDQKEENKNNENQEIKSKSEKKIITINPEEYLAKRKKKHKGGRKLKSEKITYDPVFK